MIEQIAVLSWDLNALAESMHLTQEETQEYFTDGRRVSFILERRIRREMGARLADSEGAGFDLVDVQGGKWEVRSITRGGIYFCPSYMVGSGRAFSEPGFLQKLSDIEGYVISDVLKFPAIPVWRVSQDVVHSWYTNGQLGAGTKVSRDKILELIGA